MYNYFQKHKKILKFIFIITFFFFSSLLQIIPIKIFNINVKNINDKTSIYLSMFSNIIILLTLVFVYRKNLKEDLNSFLKDKSSLFEIGFKYWVLGLVLMAVFNIIIGKILPNQIANNEKSIRSMIESAPTLMFISTTIIAPITEELVFRKSFREIIKNNTIYILISGFIFGSMHVIFDVQNLYDYLYLLPYCSLGFAFSYIYYKSKNIIVPILMHIIHNTIIVSLTLISIGDII